MQVSGSTPKRSRTTRCPAAARLSQLRLFAALAVEHALALRDDDFGPLLGRGQRLAQRVAHRGDVVGAGDAANPFHADAAHGVGDGKPRRAVGLPRARTGCPARRWPRCSRCRPPPARLSLWLNTALPTPLVRPLCQKPPSPMMLIVRLAGFGRVERRRTGPAQAVAHGGGADVEGRQDGEQVTADVAAHVMLAQFALHQLHRGEDGPLGTAGAERRRARVHLPSQAGRRRPSGRAAAGSAAIRRGA